MAENSPLKKYADEQRPESLQKNLYKIETPYDLNDDEKRKLNLTMKDLEEVKAELASRKKSK